MTACSIPLTGSSSAIWITEEAVCGVTPDNATFNLLRRNSGNMQVSMDAINSKELTSSRQYVDTKLGAKTTGGSIGFEMSYRSHDDLYRSLLGAPAWIAVAGESGISITVDATAKTYTRSSGDYTVKHSLGDLIRFNDLTGDNAAPVLITGLTATVLTAGAAPKDTLQNEVGTTDISKADYIDIKKASNTFTIIDEYKDLNGASIYSISRGVTITNLKFTIDPNAINGGTFEAMGLTHEINASLPTGAVLVEPVKTKLYAGTDGAIYSDGEIFGYISGAEMTTDTEAGAGFTIGDKDTTFIEQGRVLSDLNLNGFFANYSQYNKFISEQKARIDLLMSSSDGAMAFSYPRCVSVGNEISVSGVGSIAQNIKVAATSSLEYASSLRIQRLDWGYIEPYNAIQFLKPLDSVIKAIASNNPALTASYSDVSIFTGGFTSAVTIYGQPIGADPLINWYNVTTNPAPVDSGSQPLFTIGSSLGNGYTASTPTGGNAGIIVQTHANGSLFVLFGNGTSGSSLAGQKNYMMSAPPSELRNGVSDEYIFVYRSISDWDFYVNGTKFTIVDFTLTGGTASSVLFEAPDLEIGRRHWYSAAIGSAITVRDAWFDNSAMTENEIINRNDSTILNHWGMYNGLGLDSNELNDLSVHSSTQKARV
jgi:hypothetical protein